MLEEHCRRKGPLPGASMLLFAYSSNQVGVRGHPGALGPSNRSRALSPLASLQPQPSPMTPHHLPLATVPTSAFNIPPPSILPNVGNLCFLCCLINLAGRTVPFHNVSSQKIAFVFVFLSCMCFILIYYFINFLFLLFFHTLG